MKCFVVVICVFVLQVECMEEHVYMKHSEMQDQATSASGYAYQLHSGGPLQYTYPKLGAAEGLNQLGYPPQPVLGLGQGPLSVREYHPQQPINAYGIQGLGLGGAQGIGLPAGLQGQQIYAPQPQYQVQQYSNFPLVKLYTDISKFVKGGGSNYGDAKESSHGEKGSTAYKTIDGYSQGAKGLHDKQGHKEHYNEEDGHKKAHHDVAGHYGKKEEAAQGSEGASFSESSGHKKGSKTTGFHKVHHKDEYKKDHTFYDESDSKGHFNKHGNSNSQHSSEKGGFEKGGHEDGAYQQANKGVKGFKDEGKYVDQDSGYKGEEGKHTHHKDYASYDQKGEQQEGKEHGFLEKEELEKVQ